ncbi:MAG: M61 family metallopeptidase [Gemmatimonadota bacterium]
MPAAQTSRTAHAPTGRTAHASTGRTAHASTGRTAASPILALAALAAAVAATGPVPSSAHAQAPVRYDVRFDDAAHHEARIRVTLDELPAGPLELRMSRTSPGRYALHEFAKNVYDVHAYDAAGRELRLERPNPHQWDVPDHDGAVTVEYTLFADHADGTYPGIDRTHAHLNMPATFIFARGLGDRPVEVSFHPPEGADWRVATQLLPTDDPFTFRAPGLAYFMDSPTELSDFELREWTIGAPAGVGGEAGARGGGAERAGTQTIRLAVHHEGSAEDVDRFERMVRRVVDAQIEIFGEPPAFDHGAYTFIADYLPWVYGDGMEHRNSTILTNRRPLAGDGALGNLGTVSHEFFHAWNMERIRSAELEPFDWERENMSRDLWFGEGFTSYYDDVAIVRAGLRDLEAYAAGLASALNAVINSPARDVRSPVEMSMYSPFVDEARWVDATNTANTFISYYTWGSVIALGLDLRLRTRYDGVDLDDYMRAVWQRHGRTERPYTTADLEAVLANVTRDPGFAASFFERYIEGGDVPDYEALLAEAGLLLRPRDPGTAWIGGAAIRDDDDGVPGDSRANAGGTDRAGAIVASATRVGSPLHRAGLDRGARIVRLDGRDVAGATDVAAIVGEHRPGDRIEIVYRRRGRTHRETLELAEDPTLELVTYESAGRELTDAIRDFRAAWLGIGEPAAAASTP